MIGVVIFVAVVLVLFMVVASWCSCRVASIADRLAAEMMRKINRRKNEKD